jgi:hypothetical protein
MSNTEAYIFDASKVDISKIDIQGGVRKGKKVRADYFAQKRRELIVSWRSLWRGKGRNRKHTADILAATQ